MAEPRWLSDREQHAWRQFLDMQSQLRGMLVSRLQKETGLSGADYEVLVILSEAPDGQLRPSEVRDAIRWEKSRISHHVSRMEARGLVKRMPCPTDSRGSLVVLTPAGRRAIEKAAPRHVEHVREALIDVLTATQLDALTEISETVLAKLSAPDSNGNTNGNGKT